MKVITQHLGTIVLSVAAVALIVGIVLCFGAPLGDAFRGIIDKEGELAALDGGDGIWEQGSFNTKAYTVKLLSNAPESGTVTFVGGEADGSASTKLEGETTVTVQAEEIEGYKFTGWYDGPTLLSTANPYTLTVSEKTTLLAEYEIVLAPGLYDASNNLVASWDTLVNTYGMNATANYTSANYKTISTSPYYVLTNKSALRSGVKLVIGDIEEIGSYAFYCCDNLTSVEFPNTLKTIYANAFTKCANLTSVKFARDGQLTRILSGAFNWCSSLKNIEIPYGVTSISSLTFLGCTALESVTIPNTVTSIGDEAFWNCTSLTSIKIPASVTSVHSEAFKSCTSLSSITVDSGNTAYHSAGNCLISTTYNRLITGCKTSVIPNDGSVTSIGSYAFFGMSGLTSINIPASITSIYTDAFTGCGLTSITVDSENTTYHASGNCLIKTADKSVVLGCSTSVIPDNGSVTTIAKKAFSNCTQLTSIRVPAGIVTIDEYAFYYCTNLTSVEIANTVTTIGQYAFQHCDNLTNVTFEENSQLTTIGEYIFGDCPKLTTVTFGENSQLTTIAPNAFRSCSSLTNIAIPDAVTKIDNNAFYNCTGLTSVTFGQDSQLKYISTSAFLCCSNLNNVTIPKTVISISTAAFKDCTSLTSLSYKGTISDWSSKVTLYTNWKTNAPVTEVVCSDGTVSLS